MQQRDLFEKIWSTKDNEFIKIITGIRRSGKSFLLKLLHERLKEEGCQVFYVNFEVIPYLRITTEDKFLDWLEGIELDTEKKVYFLFDEIQYVQGWERIINGIRATYDADIYLTGSNARMLSGNLATLIAGRYIQIEVYPLSFKEFLSFTNTDKENISEAWKRYRTEGGFPALPFVENDAIRTDILQGILDTVLLKDVSSNQGISNTDLLRRITNYLMDVIGNPVSTTNIENQIASEIGKKISKTTLSNILEALESAHVFYKAQRYDIRGKERLRSLAKYYVADVGLIGVALGRTDINR
jgi:predicted AAA+ superfamily ATPase